MRVLVTGVTGFAGSHLADYLASRDDVDVYGTYRIRSRVDHVRHLGKRVRLVECELRDPTSVQALIAALRPDRIHHLAAQSFVPTSWNAPADTLINNILGEVNLLEAVRNHHPACRIQIACSSEEYGLVRPEGCPIPEEAPLRPLSPYGVSKVAQDLLGFQYHRSYGLHVVRTRAFNHEGPRRGESFVLANFAKQIALIERGARPAVLEVGNLDAVRDFTDVRDMVRAYVLALDHGQPGEAYNIGSGHPCRIGDALEYLLSLTPMKVAVRQDPGRLRPSDVPLLHCDSRKFTMLTGWTPDIPLQQTLRDTLDYWRAQMA